MYELVNYLLVQLSFRACAVLAVIIITLYSFQYFSITLQKIHA